MADVCVSSEIGLLKKVILHTPGTELEAMTPETAIELLYDDILYLPAAQKQHAQLAGVLSKIANVYQVKDLLQDILVNKTVRNELISLICNKLNVNDVKDELLSLNNKKLASQLITGTYLKQNSLSNYLSPNKFALPPLPNLFFTRDSAMVVNKKVIIGNMANKIRIMEAILMKYIFSYHPQLQCHEFLFDATREKTPNVTFEGGDILVAREDTLLIGMSERTSIPGIDYLIKQFKNTGRIKNVFVVILPKARATIHLDMVFTMIDTDKAVVYPPLILTKEAVDVIHINLSNLENPKFIRHDYLLDALKTVGIKLSPVFCGGKDEKQQEREQWMSGANFFTMGPGKVLGYGMNYNTYEELEKAGIPRIEAQDVVDGKIDLSKMGKFAVAISGNELNRGGGGCRCMTMPIQRGEIKI